MFLMEVFCNERMAMLCGGGVVVGGGGVEDKCIMTRSTSGQFQFANNFLMTTATVLG